MDDARGRCAIRLNLRESSRARIGLALVAIGAVTAALVLRAETADRVAASSGPAAPEPVFAPTSTVPPTSAIAALGPTFDGEAQLRPTGDAGQSKLWFHDGRWWGVLLAEREFRLHSFDPAKGWTDTGTLVDPRPSSHADVLDEGDSITVISAGRGASASNGVDVRRYRYDREGRVYRADRDFPVRLSTTGARHVTVARSSAGTLWAAFVTDQRLEVARTLGDDRNWSDPGPVPVAAASVAVDASAIAANGEQVVVLAASVDGGLSAHATTDGERWSSSPLVGGSAPDVERTVALRAGPAGGPRFLGLTVVEPPIDGSGNDLAPHVVAVSSQDGARWSTHAASRVEDDLEDPTLVIDEGAGEAVVFATAEGSVRMKRAPLDRLVFSSGRGLPILPADVGGQFREPTSARTVPGGAGILVLAADGGIGRYGHGAIDVPPVTGAAGQADDAVLLAESFDGRPAEAGPPPGWELGSDAGTGELSLAPGVSGLALRVSSSQPGSARACRRFVVSQPSGLRTSLSFRLAGGGTGDAVIASLRGAGESASVRVDDRGRVAWFDGAVKEKGTRTLAPATWYRIEVQVDPAARRYGFRVADAAGTTIASAERLAWRVDAARTPDQLCVATREGVGAEIAIDDVEVQR